MKPGWGKRLHGCATYKLMGTVMEKKCLASDTHTILHYKRAKSNSGHMA